MEKPLSLGAFTELDENEMMETDGGGFLLFVAGVVGVVTTLVVCIYEPIAQAVDKGNDKMAQTQANINQEPYTVNHISIWNNVTGNSSYTAYPQK